MDKNIMFPVLAALAGIASMAYTSSFCRKMRMMGEGFPGRMAARILGEDASPEEVAEALDGLRRRVRLLGLALAALFILLLAGSFLLAWSFSLNPRSLILTGLAVLALSFCLCAFILANNLRPQ